MDSKADAMMLKPTDDVLPGRVFLGDVLDIFDDRTPPAEYAAGKVVVAGGEWRREDGNRWRFWGLANVDL
ncbi:MAG: hypothetical protein B7Y80_01635 [Hyphomicrobium sp. 32-62-53]|nr:MAG: hypothetical protein B7Z29_01985 [Hyphomicrobium sp. 12-62-95]OYY01456.1 MAG: hypothetical protein B7Y80_01635 [Hyphomicrobium sp. 32-62-53]